MVRALPIVLLVATLLPVLPAHATISVPPSPWVARASMPHVFSESAATAGKDGEIYVVGTDLSARPNQPSAARYSPSSDSWTALPTPPFVPNASMVAATGLGGQIYVLGGAGSKAVNGTGFFAFDPATMGWTQLPDAPSGRNGSAAVVGLDGKFYVFGGDEDFFELNTMDVYDPAAGTWSSGPSMPQGVAYLGAAVDPSGLIYAVGGRGGPGLQIFDPTSRQWSTGPTMGVPRSFLGVTTGSDGRIYALGGLQEPGGTPSSDVAEAYDPSTKSWSYVAPLPNPEESGGAATGGDGKLYAIGGFGSGAPAGSVVASPPGLYIPTISSVEPAMGVSQGGSIVTISGSHLDGASAVYFGSTVAPALTDSDGQLTTRTPPGSGQVLVSITNANGVSHDNADRPGPNTTDLFTFTDLALTVVQSEIVPGLDEVVLAPGVPGEGVAVHLGSVTGPLLGEGGVAGAFGESNQVATIGFNVPSIPYGAHTLYSIGLTSGFVSSAQFTVIAKFSTPPYSGVPGSQVRMVGDGFGANDAVLVFGGCTARPCQANFLTIVQADANGSFDQLFTVPPAPAGSQVVGAEDAAVPAFATATFTVAPVARVEPATGPPGSLATVSGDGFGRQELVTITWNCGSAVCAAGDLHTSVMTDSRGSFSATRRVPAGAASGTYPVQMTGGTTGLLKYVAFTVT